MPIDRYRVLIVNRAGVEPSCNINNDDRSISYTYSGDAAELVRMAQEAGEQVARLGLLPVLPITESPS